MSQAVYKTAMEWYPKQWSKKLLDNLLKKKKLTQAEYDAIIEAKGEDGENE